MEKRLKVTQVRSSIGRSRAHRSVLEGLGLGRLSSEKVLEDTASIRGMIRKVQHLVKVYVAS